MKDQQICFISQYAPPMGPMGRSESPDDIADVDAQRQRVLSEELFGL